MWKSILEMLSNMNKECNYIILRNYELLSEDSLITNHDDIDILCEKRNCAIQAMRATQRAQGDLTHLKTTVNSDIIKIDLRVIGDGYYDISWEAEMLANRKFYKNLFYVMDIENYYYSLLYHCIFHKQEFKEDYYTKLEKISNEINLPFHKNLLKRQLFKFMQKKKYKDTGYRSK